MKIVVDHIAGSRRGQRQELDASDRVRFGRHPDNDISFDAHRDLDASSRHAELRRDDGNFVLVDVGSSNGLIVEGERVSEVPVPLGESIDVEFGVGGPRVRLFIGAGDEIPDQPSASSFDLPAAPASRRRRLQPVLLISIALLLAAAAVAAVVIARGS